MGCQKNCKFKKIMLNLGCVNFLVTFFFKHKIKKIVKKTLGSQAMHFSKKLTFFMHHQMTWYSRKIVSLKIWSLIYALWIFFWIIFLKSKSEGRLIFRTKSAISPFLLVSKKKRITFFEVHTQGSYRIIAAKFLI